MDAGVDQVDYSSSTTAAVKNPCAAATGQSSLNSVSAGPQKSFNYSIKVGQNDVNLTGDNFELVCVSADKIPIYNLQTIPNGFLFRLQNWCWKISLTKIRILLATTYR